MRIIRFIVSLIVTIALIVILDNRWVISGNALPPFGKLLNPFHGFWNNIEPDDASAHGQFTLKGVSDSVTVVYDTLAVPHIFATNDMDLYFAQGFITARDRLWQMEFLTHAAAGRVAEIAGAGPNNAILDYDRGQRRLGMVFAAQQALAALREDQDAMLMVEKYTEGVNAYISSLSYKSLPFEYKLLDYRPEPWTPLKCALLMKSMAQSLCMGDKDMEMTNALKLFGADAIDLLYPDRENVGDPIISNPGKWKSRQPLPDSIPLALPDVLVSVDRLARPDPGVGSNNWALAGSKTASGSPLLCGDPHLNLNMPSIWYLVQLHAPGINVLGVSLPGSPGVVIGTTETLAWSETNAQRDLVDWYAITFKDGTREKYLLDGQWIDTRKAVEAHWVRDRAVVYDTIVFTEWGPVPYDDGYHPDENRKQYAFRWVAHDPSHDLAALYKLNRVKNVHDFDEALRLYASPALNFAIATVDGDIGMRVAGRFPVRRVNEGRFVLDGTRRSSGWQAFIPFDEQITSLNPPRGFESSANQYPVDDTYPYYITATSFEAYRNRRINQQLEAMTKATPSDMMALQTDNYSLMAAENLPWMLAQLDSSILSVEERHVARSLTSWNVVNNAEATTPSYYAAWIRNIMDLSWDEMTRSDLLLDRPTTFTTLRLLQDRPDLKFFDILTTPEKESGQDIVHKAFQIAVGDVSRWRKTHGDREPRWTDFKATRIHHLLRIEPLGQAVTGGGSVDAINALSRNHGPSWRMVVSMEPAGVRMWGTYPGGQSGNPGSVHYDNLITSWEQGRYHALQLLKQPADIGSRHLYTMHINQE